MIRLLPVAMIVLLGFAAPALARQEPKSQPCRTNIDVKKDNPTQVTEDYFRALERKDYACAASLWDSVEGSRKQFSKKFSKIATVTATVGKAGEIEGAAGSWFVEIPVDVTLVLTSGERQACRHIIALKKINAGAGSALPAKDLLWKLFTESVGDRQGMPLPLCK